MRPRRVETSSLSANNLRQLRPQMDLVSEGISEVSSTLCAPSEVELAFGFMRHSVSDTCRILLCLLTSLLVAAAFWWERPPTLH